MMGMIERVARALTETQIRSANELFKLSDPRRVRTEEQIIASIDASWRMNEKDARAAIEAMMEPTSKMLDAAADEEDRRGYFSHENLIAEDVWPIMIQAALKEAP